MKLRSVVRYMIIPLVLGLSGTAYAYANIFRLALIDHSDFREFDGNLYLSGTLSNEAEHNVISLLEAAKERITEHYGLSTAQPVVIVLNNQEEQKDYGLHDSPGKLFIAPWNNYLLLNYQVMNIDVTAHELIHAEVVSRVGYFKRQTKIPTWFDEGAAMQVDHRPRYVLTDAIDQSEFDRVIRLNTPSKFWSSDKNQNIQNYRSAKSAVFEVLRNSNDDLYAMLAMIRKGEESVLVHSADKANKRQ